ncbi:sugar ABC transporter ATP-binding protein [Vallitalea pronyensis]|uniref:Ribose/galactose/methyl galactoside import ATP-binding protein n=1 Tax=Vallitalea pronyensis TaxID=1348613 RepID=A0A8J8MJ18_9FIRM|nr:sugar ABC transporter ATP-binding protein [Vallitalea pronyensis]QUI22188.1 sugar ABC transporter ATP-binding protein [Vallitalea pronyensis]
MRDTILEMKQITKRFPGVLALDQVSFDLIPGEVHVLMGENGAGKSTLMKILAGIFQQDHGEVIYNGEVISLDSPKTALDMGISMIHQELNTILDMTVAENISLGKEPGSMGFVNRKVMNETASSLLKSIDVEIDPNTKMRDLSIAQMQMIEIAKAISYRSNIIIMDEPTSAISEREVENLFHIIQRLKKQQVAIIYISHKMKEIYQIADRITIFRDGQYIATKIAEDLPKEELIALMVGRKLDQMFPEKDNQVGETILEVKNLSLDGVFEDVNFQLKKGEILGFAGLMGAGRSEVVETIFGIHQATGGVLEMAGNRLQFRSPSEAIKHGFAMVTEDRKKTGLNLKTSIMKDMTITSLDQLCQLRCFLDHAKEAKYADQQINSLNIKTPSRHQKVSHLSGGNQQKVIVGRWLMTEPDILIMDEPTRGIDVGAKYEIYAIILELAKRGKSIIVVSSELPEIIGLCDRVVIMHEGKVTGILEREAFSQERIMAYATNHQQS